MRDVIVTVLLTVLLLKLHISSAVISYKEPKTSPVARYKRSIDGLVSSNETTCCEKLEVIRTDNATTCGLNDKKAKLTLGIAVGSAAFGGLLLGALMTKARVPNVSTPPMKRHCGKCGKELPWTANDEKHDEQCHMDGSAASTDNRHCNKCGALYDPVETDHRCNKIRLLNPVEVMNELCQEINEAGVDRGFTIVRYLGDGHKLLKYKITRKDGTHHTFSVKIHQDGEFYVRVNGLLPRTLKDFMLKEYKLLVIIDAHAEVTRRPPTPLVSGTNLGPNENERMTTIAERGPEAMMTSGLALPLGGGYPYQSDPNYSLQRRQSNDSNYPTFRQMYGWKQPSIFEGRSGGYNPQTRGSIHQYPRSAGAYSGSAVQLNPNLAPNMASTLAPTIAPYPAPSYNRLRQSLSANVNQRYNM